MIETHFMHKISEKTHCFFVFCIAQYHELQIELQNITRSCNLICKTAG